MHVPFERLSLALVLCAGCNGRSYGFPEPCEIREVDADFVTPWGSLAEVAAASAGPVEIEWNSPGNPIPTSWTLETGTQVIQAGVCEDFDDQLNYLSVEAQWSGPHGLTFPARFHGTWDTDGRLIQAGAVQTDESIPTSWVSSCDAFFIEAGYRAAGDPGELTGVRLGITNDAATLRATYRTEDGEEWVPNHEGDQFLVPLNGVLVERQWPPSNGPLPLRY